MMRPMCEEDIETLAKIEQEIFSVPWSKRAFADALHDPNAVFLVADIPGEEKPCAYVGMYTAADEGEITNVATREGFRGRGIAEELLSKMKGIAVQRGLTQLVLEVRKSNREAIGLYQKTGFAIVSERKGFYRFPPEDAYVMILKLRE